MALTAGFPRSVFEKVPSHAEDEWVPSSIPEKRGLAPCFTIFISRSVPKGIGWRAGHIAGFGPRDTDDFSRRSIPVVQRHLIRVGLVWKSEQRGCQDQDAKIVNEPRSTRAVVRSNGDRASPMKSAMPRVKEESRQGEAVERGAIGSTVDEASFTLPDTVPGRLLLSHPGRRRGASPRNAPAGPDR